MKQAQLGELHRALRPRQCVHAFEKQGVIAQKDQFHRWPQSHLARRGQVLAPGTFALAGSHTGVHRAKPGERLHCVFEGIGHVALTLRDAMPTISEEQDHVGR